MEKAKMEFFKQDGRSGQRYDYWYNLPITNGIVAEGEKCDLICLPVNNSGVLCARASVRRWTWPKSFKIVPPQRPSLWGNNIKLFRNCHCVIVAVGNMQIFDILIGEVLLIQFWLIKVRPFDVDLSVLSTVSFGHEQSTSFLFTKMIGILLYLFCLSTNLSRADFFAGKSITRALVPPRRDNEYRNIFSTTTTLPQVIINRRTTTVAPQRDSQGYFYDPQTSTTTVAPQRDSQGYYYDPPNNGYIPPDTSFADEPVPPPFADEYPSVDNQYLPPDEDTPSQDGTILGDPPVNDYLPPLQQQPQQPPQRDEILIVTPESGYQYNPPSSPSPPLADEGFSDPSADNGYNYDPPANGYLPPVGRALRDEVPNSARFPIRLQLNELTCLQNGGGFFRSSLTVQSAIDSAPLVDVDNADDISACDVRVQQSSLLVNIDYSDFTRCGVQQCGSNVRELCLRLRFPQITGMRTGSDAILTLQCKIQQRVVAKTHAVRLGVSNDVQGRSASGTFAYGGSQRPFRSQLGLFRRQADGNAFTRSLEPGGAVMLGEELILRTQVRSGDGWNFTRLSDVIMQRLSPTGSVLNSAILVATNGCLNPAMKAICPANPVLESPLSYRLSFRAAMFQGMRSGDEMVMRVRIVGCVDRRECTVENCASVRSKRDTATNSTDTDETTVAPPEHELPSEVASISFRIMIPSNSTASIQPASQSSSILTLSAAAISLIMVIALIILVSIIKLYRTKKLSYDEYRSD